MISPRSALIFTARCLPALLCLASAWPLSRVDPAEILPRTVQFTRDIRPIPSGRGFHCHGPAKAKRKATLRLDTEEGAFADLGDSKAIVPGDPSHSEVFRRITTADEAERMPPAKSGPQLSEHQIALL